MIWRERYFDNIYFDLSFFIEPKQDQLFGSIEYNTDLYDDDVIDRLIGHYQQLIQNIAQDSQQPVKSYCLLTSDEKQIILQKWNQTEKIALQKLSIQKLLLQQVQQNPSRIALQAGVITLTYQQLNNQANQLAHYLQSKGIQRRDLVGIFLPRSIWQIIYNRPSIN